MKLLIFHFALLFVIVIANPINPVEDPTEELNKIPESKIAKSQAFQPLRTDTEYGDKFQGDIMLSPDQDESMISETGVKNISYRWPKIGGFVRVPYVFNIGYTTAQRDIIKAAMAEIQTKTCVRFNLKTNETNFIRFTNGNDGCWSSLGKRGGVQILSLQAPGCVDKGVAMHELIHALGYGHQQSHYLRDQKVTIFWDNIIPNMVHNFDILNPTEYSNFVTPYDIDSIMHYDGTAFAKQDGLLTMQAILPAERKRMGQRYQMSAGDITRIKNMYKC